MGGGHAPPVASGSTPAPVPPEAAFRPDLRYAWRGPSLLIVEPAGWAGAHPLTGYYFRQTRYLKELRLTLRGEATHPCTIAAIAPHELELTHIYPEVEAGGGGGSGSGGLGERDGVLYRDLDLRLRYIVHAASLEVVLLITNRWQDLVEIDARWALSADFATVDEAQFGKREQHAPVRVESRPRGLSFRYTHADLPLAAHVTAAGADWKAHGDALEARLRIARQQTAALTLRVRAADGLEPIDEEGERRREEKGAAWQQRAWQVYAPEEPPFVEYTNRAAHDLGSLALLEGPEDEWLTPGAGVPLYLSLWGRDALTAAWQAGLVDRGDMLGAVLATLTRLQGTRTDPARDEQPGRIINQSKKDAVSRVSPVGFARAYADVASPFMFLIGLGYHYALTGDSERVRRHWDAALRVLDWAAAHGDRNGDGYIDYLTQSPVGPRHQGWKDSENAVVDEHGRQVEPPIAPCETQGYYYVALQFAAVLALVLGERGRAFELWRRAADLKDRFNRDFWLDDEGYVAFGLDADRRPIRALTSNAAQCLPTGIVDTAHVPRLVRRMFEPDLFSGWGIRTLSTKNPAYNPLDYHLGSVWPVENASILFGLRRYGLNDRALQLTRALYDLARLWPGGRTPECVGGYSRDELAHPGAYPRANGPQTWNQTAWPIMVQCLLGLVPCAPLQLLLVDPQLPPWLPELTVKQLRVGKAEVSLRFRRTAEGASAYEVLDRRGPLRIVRQPWLESFTADMWERLGGALDSLRSHERRRA